MSSLGTSRRSTIFDAARRPSHDDIAHYAVLGVLVLAVCFAPAGAYAQEPPELDFLYFQERVQPILLAEPQGAPACATCHVRVQPRLEPLTDGAQRWTNEQSRKNFAIWREYVTPGDPLESPLLTAPLAKPAGGTDSHGGGKRWTTTVHTDWLTLANWVLGQKLGGVSVATGSVRLLQTHGEAPAVAVIDPQSLEAVGWIEGVSAASGIAIAADGSRVYIANPSRSTLDIADSKTLRVFKSIPLSGEPSGVAVTPSGDKVYAGIRSGAIDVVDARGLTRIRSVPVGGPVDGLAITPDGIHVFAHSLDSHALRALDTSRDEVTWTLELPTGIGPLTFVTGGDGSTRWVLAKRAGLHGFEVIDFGTRAVLQTVEFPVSPRGPGLLSHGLVADVQGDVVWASSRGARAIYAYGIPEPCRPGWSPDDAKRCSWELLATVDVKGPPDWLALTPDRKRLFVQSGRVLAAVDTEAKTVSGPMNIGRLPGPLTIGELSIR